MVRLLVNEWNVKRDKIFSIYLGEKVFNRIHPGLGDNGFWLSSQNFGHALSTRREHPDHDPRFTRRG